MGRFGLNSHWAECSTRLSNRTISVQPCSAFSHLTLKNREYRKKIFFGKIFIRNHSYRSFPRRFFIILGIGFISRKSRGWRSEICSHELWMSTMCQGDICVTLTEWTVLMLVEPFANALFAKSMLAIWCIQWIFKHTYKIILYILYMIYRAYYMPHISISL